MTYKEIIKYSYFVFVALLAASIPVSRTFISVFQFCLAGIFILEGIKPESYLNFYRRHKHLKIILLFLPFHILIVLRSVADQFVRVSKNRLFLVFLLVSGVYLAGLAHTSNFNDALRVLRNQLPVLLMPLFFTAITSINQRQKNIILMFFVLSASVSSFISFGIFLSGQYDDIRRISPFINHIHLSIFISYAVFILFHFIRTGFFKPAFRIPAILLMSWLVTFLVLILKSLTGVIILFLGFYLILILPDLFGVRMNNIFRYALIILLPLITLSVLAVSVIRFYQVEDVNPDELEKYSAQGTWYHHDLDNRMLENGHFVFIYIAEKELREEWAKVSDYNIDSLDDRGQEIKYTLVRYLTSKGLRKDAEGMQQLESLDIRMIEQGFANHIYSRKLSLYPRIYQVLWELDVYFKSGNPTGHSVTQRLESLKMGLSIFKRNPIFGIGTGDLLASYHKQYELSGSPVPKEQRITGANQFLNFAVNFGIAGLLIILFAWLYPAIKSRAFSNPLFVMFFFVACVAMFSEEILRFQTGVSFFAFFYSFFIFLGNSNPDSQAVNLQRT